MIVYRPYDASAKEGSRWGEDRYAAFVLKRTGDPAFADLGKASVIDAQVGDLRKALSDPSLDPKPAGLVRCSGAACERREGVRLKPARKA